jgi:hypothetical protein
MLDVSTLDDDDEAGVEDDEDESLMLMNENTEKQNKRTNDKPHKGTIDGQNDGLRRDDSKPNVTDYVSDNNELSNEVY